MNKIVKTLQSLVRFLASFIADLVTSFIRFISSGIMAVVHLVKNEHRYVYLASSLMALATALLAKRYYGPLPSKLTFSIFYPLPNMVLSVLLAADLVFVIISCAAFLDKLRLKRQYAEKSIFATKLKKFAHYYSIYVGFFFFMIVLDVVILGGLVSGGYRGIHAASNPSDFLESMFYMASRSLPSLSSGIGNTIKIALVGTLFGFLLGCLLVFLRIQKIDKRDNDFVKLLKKIGLFFSKAYINMIRCTPMMVQAFIVYYSVFNLIKANNPGISASEINRIWPLLVSGMVTVSLNSTAYLAEVLRGGIEAIDWGQTEAARSLGLSQWQTMIHVIFPQAVKNSIPAIGNEFIINIKDSSVLQVIGVFDLMYASSTISGTYFRVLEVYVTTAIIYFVITITLTSCLNILARKLDMPDTRGVPSSN